MLYQRLESDREATTVMRLSGWAVFVLAFAVLLSTGCRINRVETARAIARLKSLTTDPVAQVKPIPQPRQLSLIGRTLQSPPPPSDRTLQLLRRYNMEARYSTEPEFVIDWMQRICRTSPSMEEVHALAEIALIHGNWAVRSGQNRRGAELYGAAIVHAYQFLFDSKLDIQRNAYDPQFRSICDIYNSALEGTLRIMCGDEALHNGAAHRIGDEQFTLEFRVELRGRWKTHHFDRFELASDYAMEGIKNLYHTYGLGVPLIAVHGQHESHSVSEGYYPPNLTLPMTAFCHVLPANEGDEANVRRAVLSLYDPLEQTSVKMQGRSVPLESDITTPLAYHLDDPLLSSGILETATMINANLANDIYGLFMLEPYDPEKIPVVMVHGLWSSPITWLEMFNDLRANKQLRGNCQFWFYAYPTGQPFWNSARQMRTDLRELRTKLDPEGKSQTLNKMVLVGHSMGGMVSRLQTISGGNEFWNIVSDQPFESLEGDPEKLKLLKDTFLFDANPDVTRVVTIATPHEGSPLANAFTKWASQKVFTLPELITNDFVEIAKNNADKFKNQKLLTVKTSIDSLAPDSPFVQVMKEIKPPSEVRFHNIVGNLPRHSFLRAKSLPGVGDGVVSLESAKAFDVESEIEVPSEHSEVHRHPRSILEVRRILLEHLADLGRIADPRVPVVPTGYESEFENPMQIRRAELIAPIK